MSAISAAYQCGNCAEWHDQEEDALECCAPTAIDGWKCDACGDHHKLKANAEACCGFQCAECASRLSGGLGDAVTFDSFFDEMQRLEDERDPIGAQDRRDAKLYRWLRARDIESINSGGIFAGMTPDNIVLNGDDLDRAIDTAMIESPNAEVRGDAPLYGAASLSTDGLCDGE